jgi:hypothetical protein
MFFHFEEVIGVGEAWVGLPSPHVKNLRTLIMLKTLFSSNIHVSNEWHLTTMP